MKQGPCPKKYDIVTGKQPKLFRMHQTNVFTTSIIGLGSLFYWFISISLKKSTQSGLEPKTSGLQERRANHYTTEVDGDVIHHVKTNTTTLCLLDYVYYVFNTCIVNSVTSFQYLYSFLYFCGNNLFYRWMIIFVLTSFSPSWTPLIKI